jgi:DNA-binding FadR family transcriptional regulator
LHLSEKNVPNLSNVVAQNLQRLIASGSHAAGKTLPSQHTLPETLGISRACLSGNEVFALVLRQSETPVAYSLRLPFANSKGIWETADEHRAVIKAIVAHNLPAARLSMQTHLLRAAARADVRFINPTGEIA